MNKAVLLSQDVLAVSEAVERLRQGEMVLICDDPERENEADLCMAAQFVTPEMVNFLLREAHGLICVALAGDLVDSLQLPLMDDAIGDPLQGTAFTISVDARIGTTTGISARDRAQTIRTLIDPHTAPTDLARPGNVFPLRARAGGTRERRGHTEAAVDLMGLAGLLSGAIICEVLDATGEAARGPILREMSQRWQISIITVDAIANACQR